MAKWIKLFLRFGLAGGFLVASGDRLGFFPRAVSSWGSWQPFLDYTAKIAPWAPEALIPLLGFTVTVLEIILGLALLLGVKTELAAKISGALLIVFAISMTVSVGIKNVLDYSVFVGAAAAFALGMMRDKFYELDTQLFPHQRRRKRILEKDKTAVFNFLRITLIVGFLSAVADRFGIWGAPGKYGIAWGDWSSFVEYTQQLAPWSPEGLTPILAVIATALEVVFALCLAFGWKMKFAGYGAGILVLIFALSMSFSGGMGVFLATFGMSLYSFSAGAFYLGYNAKS